MNYTFNMKIKCIFINIDKLRSFVFPNILVLYIYLQTVFLLIYSQINNNAVLLSQTDINTKHMFDFSVVFMSVLIYLFMICFCSVMTFIEYILRNKINLKIININKFSNLCNKLHTLLFYFGLIIIFTYIFSIIYLYIS